MQDRRRTRQSAVNVWARSALCTALVLGISACGFQLRGSGSGSALPDDWRSMYLMSDNPNGELTRIVESTFSANGVVWGPRKEVRHLLRLGPERFSQRNLSVNAQARAAEFDLQMRADFSVIDAAGRTVMPRTSAAVNKQMENDPQNVVGKAEEVRILRSELRTELANQILRRISFFAANNPRANPGAPAATSSTTGPQAGSSSEAPGSQPANGE